MKLNTLNTLIDDILLEMRNNNISESESINKNQIEQWIHQYRALVLRQAIDKGSYIDKISYQKITIDGFDHDEYISFGSLPIYRLSSKIDIPSTIETSIGRQMISLYDMSGNEIQVMSMKRADLSKRRRHTSNSIVGYIDDNRLHLLGDIAINKAYMHIVANDPTLVPGFSPNDEYPLSPSLIPTIKNMIFKQELKIEMPTDNINDSKNNLENLNANK